MKTFLKLSLTIVALASAGCGDRSPLVSSGSLPATEVSALQSNPFDPDTHETGVDDSEDAFIPNLTKVPAEHPTYVSRCTKAVYDAEMQEALAAAASDPTHRTIPVRYAVSVGSIFDDLAWYAHRRSILRADSTMITPIAVAPANSLAPAYYNGAKSLHYFVDHSHARKDFIDGSHCYFDTVTVVSKETGHGIYDETGVYNHPYNILYYGDTYDPNDPRVIEGLASPRLFAPIETADYTKTRPQIVPLYVADFRNGGINDDPNLSFELLDPSFSSSAIRRHEYYLTFKQIFQFRNFWTYRDQITRVLSTNRTVEQTTGKIIPPGTLDSKPVYPYSAYEGVPQLIDWVVFSGLDATMMSTQYTPLVMDLGRPNIRLSSLKWGSFFNLPQLKNNAASDPTSLFNVSPMTSWLGGYVVDSHEPNSVNPVTLKRRAEDGFLVLRAPGGQIGPQNLFGSSTIITANGKSQTYANGFDALAALAGKNCSSKVIKDRYVGPWDGDLFATTLGVWVDTNRNGIADAGEVTSLADAHVAAIDACFKLNQAATDKFGNATSMRAAFLMMDSSETVLGNENEIVNRLKTGKTSAGKDASFRVIIDVLFQTDPSFYLENIDSANVGQ